MRKLFVFVILLSVAVSIFSQNTYTISGTLENLGNEKVTLSYYDGTNPVQIETQAVKGQFALTGVAPQGPVVARLNSSYDRNVYLGENKSSMYIPAPPLEFVLSPNSTLVVKGDAKTLNLSSVEGDSFNKAFNKYRSQNAMFVSKFSELQSYLVQAQKMGLKEDVKELGKQMFETREKSILFQREFIRNNPDEFVSAWLLSVIAKEYQLADLKTAYNGLSSRSKETAYGKSVASRIEVLEATEGKKTAPEFTKPGVDGSPVSLSQFRGKYVLLDFWGSWCGPCRAANPHLKEVYAKYKPKGFEILGIACEKVSKTSDAIALWKKAIEADNLTWTHVINNEDKPKYDLTKLYGIDGYPTKILIDPAGSIVARWMGAESDPLDAKLNEIFGF